jgi:hypothetical protein
MANVASGSGGRAAGRDAPNMAVPPMVAEIPPRAHMGLRHVLLKQTKVLGGGGVGRAAEESCESRSTFPCQGRAVVLCLFLRRSLGEDRRTDRRSFEPRRFGPGTAAQEADGKRSRPEMAPQRLEKIESGPGSGMGSEASNLHDLVHGRAADRVRLRLTRRENDEVVKGRANPQRDHFKFSPTHAIATAIT